MRRETQKQPGFLKAELDLNLPGCQTFGEFSLLQLLSGANSSMSTEAGFQFKSFQYLETKTCSATQACFKYCARITKIWSLFWLNILQEREI